MKNLNAVMEIYNDYFIQWVITNHQGSANGFNIIEK